VLFSAWFMCGASPSALAEKNNVEIAGFGHAKCSDFLGHTSQGRPVQLSYLAWAQGFMSALNLARSQHEKPTRQLGTPNYSFEKQLAFLVAYCNANKSRSFADATIQLYRSLPGQ
jgi:hypothetical protein